MANYEVRVSKLGGGSLGMYLPKDLVRVMGVEGGEQGFVTPIDQNTFAIRLERPAESDAKNDSIEDVILL